MPPDLALWFTLISSNYPNLEDIFMVPKLLEPLKFDCSFWENDLNAKHWQKFVLPPTMMTIPQKQYICLTNASQTRQYNLNIKFLSLWPSPIGRTMEEDGAK